MTRTALVVRAGLALALVSGCASLDGLSEDARGSHTQSTQPPPSTNATTKSAKSCDPASPFKSTTQLVDHAFGARWDAAKSLVVYNAGSGLDVELRLGADVAAATATPFAPILPSNDAAAANGTPTPILMFASLSNDGLFLYYAAFFPAFQQYPPTSSVYRARRATKDEAFHDFAPVLSQSSMDFYPYLVSSVNALYWLHTDPTNGTQRVLRYAVDSAADPTSVWDTTTEIHCPVVSADELTLYYTDVSSGSHDVWMTTRASTNVPFSTGKRIDTLSTAEYDEDPSWVSDDQCELVYTRHDANGVASTVWSAKR